MGNNPNKNQYEIKVVEKSMRVLGVLADGNPRTLTEISKDVKINKSTTFRILATLSNLNYVKIDDQTNKYHLGLTCLELAAAYQSGDELLHVARPKLEELRDITKETVHLAVLVGMDVVYIDKMEGLHAIGLMSSRVGRRAPAYCTGVGKILLSYANPKKVREELKISKIIRFNERTIVDQEDLLLDLAASKERGFAFDRGEHELDVRCIAAPIFNSMGEVTAAISVSGPSSRMDPIDENEHLSILITQVATEISSLLGYRKLISN